MPDPADVVPLRRDRSATFREPTAVFADRAEPARGLTLTWSPDQQAVRLGIESPDEGPAAVVLRAEDLLDLVQALMDGLPRRGADTSPLADVLPLRPRPSHPLTEDS